MKREQAFDRIRELVGNDLSYRETTALTNVFPYDELLDGSEEENREFLEQFGDQFVGACEWLWMALKITEEQKWDLIGLLDEQPEGGAEG